MSDTSGIEAVDSANIEADDAGLPVGNDAGSGNDEISETGGHPAWKEILDTLPSSLHSVVTPALEKWDQGVQDRFEQVQSKYEPYKEILDSEIPPDNIQRAIAIQNMLENDPQGFYQRMGSYFGQGQQSSNEEDDSYSPGDDDNDEGVDPRFAQLEQSQQAILQQMQTMAQKEADEKADAELTTKLDALRNEHGDFDEEYVINYAMTNGGKLSDIDKGMSKYLELVGKIKGAPAPGSNLPNVVSPSGATQSTKVDPATLDKNGTQDLVRAMLQKAHENS